LRQLDGIHWTNKSVTQLAGGEDPVAIIERKTRELVLQARDAGWEGPPFNPIAIADLLRIPVEANADVSDAKTVPTGTGLKIQFNPTQARERVRFSIAHEIAHTLFPDVADKVRHRGPSKPGSDDWQLEMLCNLAAAEFVMPMGSLPGRDVLPSIEDLMLERRKFDVSAEAFLIRITKISKEPIVMFCASPFSDEQDGRSYRIDYTVSSKSAPGAKLYGRTVPPHSIVQLCTAIGYTDRQRETWFWDREVLVECVGIPGYPGSRYPRVAGLLRFTGQEAQPDTLKFIHGDVLDPRGANPKVVCQLVNDQARTWGGGVAKAAAKKFPAAQKQYSGWFTSIPRSKRLGEVHFSDVEDSIVIASLLAQEGYGPSAVPRIRYAALERCLERVARFASEHKASVHLPRIGAGQSGGSWDTVEEIVRSALLAEDVAVTVYDLPPKRAPIPDLFD
jgi:O-acetyl-ADP-ribose deacetylase (regulator of RNase III)